MENEEISIDDSKIDMNTDRFESSSVEMNLEDALNFILLSLSNLTEKVELLQKQMDDLISQFEDLVEED